MSTMTYADTAVDVDAEGFMTDPSQWNEGVAAAIAAEAGIGELTDRHWLVVNFMRDRYLESGSAPSIRTLGKASGVPIKELYESLDPEAFWQIHRGSIVSLRAIERVDRDWRGEPVIVLKDRDEKLAVSRTFAHLFKAM